MKPWPNSVTELDRFRMPSKTLRILGTRGVPAAHGGFETFAEYLSTYLARRGWRVIVYCQEDGEGVTFEDIWEGVERVRIPISNSGPKGTVLFDWKSVVHASMFDDLCLTLGYNTAIFGALLKLRGVRNVINMDGIEWRRQKWGNVAKIWFWANDWAGCWLGDHLVADNPGIRDHLATRVNVRKITTIPYGADRLENLSDAPVAALGLESGRYWTVIARAEPENSILEIVSAFSRKSRGVKLAILGRYEPDRNVYHRAVQAAASDEVVFLGAIYDPQIVKALRFHAAGYLHGHQVGGTNPSLVEAMGAGNAIIAHGNKFNRWVVGSSALFFLNEHECAAALDHLLNDEPAIAALKMNVIERYEEALTWDSVLGQYEQLLLNWIR
jgi:glycosyltransferase involved in cell wall biosynthesis